jgi:unsaturated rhamnogalacturonyl hydrolase
LGYLPERDSSHAQLAWQGVLKHFVQQNPDGVVTVTDGSLHSALSGPDEENSPGPQPPLRISNKEGASLGALLLAATEIGLAPTAVSAHGETVMLDAWYNSQRRTNAAGLSEFFHYKWSDLSNSGYALLGHIFQSYGAMKETLYSAPTQSNLAKAQFYIIASPDIPIKNPNPNYMTDHDAEEIAAWVKNGGVLVLMENDAPNADVPHLNLLADRFGIHFDEVLHHHIVGEHVEDGRIPVAAGGPVFHHPHTLYMKDTCAISLREPAIALLRDRGDVVMATAKYGRGTVFAAVDPWLYNEYTDGRNNPQIYNQFDNFAGGKELVQWLLQQRPH